MPYFFKLSDIARNIREPIYYTNQNNQNFVNYQNINEEWVEAVRFAVQDLSFGCHRASVNKADDYKDVVILFVGLNDNEINRHPNPRLVFEYTTPNTVHADRILSNISDLFTYHDADDGTLRQSLINNFIQWYVTYLNDGKLNNIYIHITCNYLYDSIERRGLLGESENNIIRVGDREDGHENIVNPSLIRQKYLKYKQKYLKLKQLINKKN
jgi:hypothetical protein